MLYKILIVALATSTVHARPQLSLIQPLFFHRQDYLLPLNLESAVTGERTFFTPETNLQPPKVNENNNLVNSERRTPLRVSQRRTAISEDDKITPNQNQSNNRRHLTNLVKTNRQNYQLVKTNTNNQTSDRLESSVINQQNTRLNVVYSNRSKDIQNTTPNQSINKQMVASQNENFDKTKQNMLNEGVYNQGQTMAIATDQQTTLPESKNIVNQTLHPNLNAPKRNKQQNNPTFTEVGNAGDLLTKPVTTNDSVTNGNTNSSEAKRVLTQSPVPPSVSQTGSVWRMGDDSMKNDDDRWVWGLADVTEKEVTATTPDVADRASFDGDACPTGQIKAGTICVDSH